MAEVVMSQYVIYEHPRDYPESFVVRRWDVVDGVPAPVPCGNPVLANSLDEARLMIPAG